MLERVTVILAAAWLLTLGLRRAPAAARHMVWTLAIVAAMLTPALSAVPTWPVPLPAVLARWASPAAVITTGAPDLGANAAPAVSVPVMPGRAVSDEAVATASQMTPWAFVVALWAFGGAVILLHMLSGIAATFRLRRSATLAGGASWVAEAQAIAADMGIDRVAFGESDQSQVPFVCGVLEPLVIMPAAAPSWPSDKLRVVLLHELAHVKRRDCLTQLLARVAVAMYWFHPLTWLAAHRLHLERERACDDVVLMSGVRGTDYAAHLVDIASAAVSRRSPFAAAGVAMARRGRLETRLMSILDPQLIRTSRRSTRLVVGAFGLVVLAAASLQIQAQAPAPAPAGAQTPAPANVTFEVASIKRNKMVEAQRAGLNPNVPTVPGRAQTLPGGTLLGRGMTVRELIRDAYGYRNRAQGDIVGGPGWIDIERYDVQAKTEYAFPPSTSSGLPPAAEGALRALLVERFNLIARVESSIRPVYELVLHRKDGQLGPNLKPSKGGCRPFFQREAVNAGLVIQDPGPDAPAPLRPCPLLIAPGIIRAENMTMTDWVRILALTPQLNRTVIDRTGLTGGFDIQIGDPEAARTGPMELLPPIKPPLESQLGLTVRDAEAPVEVVVIEQVERPTEN